MKLPSLPRIPALRRRTARPRVPEVNLLPPAYQPGPAITLRTLVMLVVLLEVLAAAAVYQLGGQSTVDGARSLVTSYFAEESQTAVRIDRLEAILSDLEKESAGLDAARRLLEEDRNWAFLLQEVLARVSPGVSVESVRQTATGFLVTGHAEGLAGAEAYRIGVEEMPEVGEVSVTGIQQLPQGQGLTFNYDIRLR